MITSMASFLPPLTRSRLARMIINQFMRSGGNVWPKILLLRCSRLIWAQHSGTIAGFYLIAFTFMTLPCKNRTFDDCTPTAFGCTTPSTILQTVSAAFPNLACCCGNIKYDMSAVSFIPSFRGNTHHLLLRKRFEEKFGFYFFQLSKVRVLLTIFF